ncbi:N-acetylglucosaminyl-phosphatidylinositol de-N-acetylase [Tulasnella sp. JGI-2019a]|nr:N-acetylglucosaminyl-phosphatidylinositol de-N-acetylase [Tulasnella sp. JGI-2019a]
MFVFLVLPLILSILFVPWNPRGLPLSSSPIGLAERPGGSRALLVTAHPDDECLFFAPTILSLREEGTDVYGLVLSIGNQDGLGNVRQGEAKASFEVLGVHADRVRVLDHPKLQDNITAIWEEALVQRVIAEQVEEWEVTDLITFDSGGVSNHPNHISVYNGARLLLSSYDPTKGLRLFKLETVRLTRKYTGILAPLSTRAALWMELYAVPAAGRLAKEYLGVDILKPPSHHTIFLSSASGYWTAVQAMRQHPSQLVWFRWLNVMFSRYMWVNDLIEVTT